MANVAIENNYRNVQIRDKGMFNYMIGGNTNFCHTRLIYALCDSIPCPILFQLKLMWDDEGAIVHCNRGS